MTDDVWDRGDWRRTGSARDEASRVIDVLMSQPPKPRPSIIVIGDDAVFGITPARAIQEFGSSARQG